MGFNRSINDFTWNHICGSSSLGTLRSGFHPSRLSATNVSNRAAGLPHFSLCLSSLPDDVTLQQVSNTKRAVNATGESAATTLAQTVEVGFSHYFSLSLGWGEGTAQVWQRPPLTDSTPASSARPSAEAAGLERSVVRARVQSEEGLPTGRDAFRSGGGERGNEPGAPPAASPSTQAGIPCRLCLTPLSVLQRKGLRGPGQPFSEGNSRRVFRSRFHRPGRV